MSKLELQLEQELGLLRVVKVAPPKVVKGDNSPTNYVFILDCSGSMWGVMDKLKADIKANLADLEANATISIARFSGIGDFNFFVKGFKLNRSEDIQGLFTLVDKYIYASGCTCYSEVFQSVTQVIEDLAVFSKKFSLAFLTDGYPNQGSDVILFQEIAKVKGYLNSALIIGYGDYYNKTLLSTIAGSFDSCQLVHADSSKKSEDFTQYFKGFITSSIEEGIKVDVGDATTAFGMVNDSIVRFAIHDKTILVPKSLAQVYLVVPGTSPNTKVDTVLLRGLYGLAVLKIQELNIQQALNILQLTEDVAAMDSVSSAFTMYEYGAAEKLLTSCVFDAKIRFSKGKKATYLPDPNGFCLYDALQLLLADPHAVFYPRHEEFVYNRIGKPASYQPTDLTFVAADSVSCPFSKLVWNKTRLNLSILAVIPGHIHGFDPVEVKKYKIPSKFPSSVFRNYALIADGVLNVRTLPISCSKAVLDRLTAEGLIKEYDENINLLDLTAVPLITRKYVNTKPSAKALATIAVEERILESRIKVVKHIISSLSGDVEVSAAKSSLLIEKYGDEAAEYLRSLGITDSGYAPKSDSSETTDQYVAKEFELKIKSFSSIPAISAVETKLTTKKSLTLSEQVLAEGIQLISDLITPNNQPELSKELKLKELNTVYEGFKADLASVRNTLQVNKFAIILCKQWFSEFTSFNPKDCVVTTNLDGREYQVTFELSDTVVKI